MLIVAGTLLWRFPQFVPDPQPVSLQVGDHSTADESGGLRPERFYSTESQEAPVGTSQELGLVPNEEQRREMAEAAWQRQITFYGKVVDENGNPIAGVTVNYIWTTLDGTPKAQTTSDSQGVFRISGLTGKRLAVYVSKEGYYGSNTQNSFDYGSPSLENYHVPDAANPVVFRLRKKGERADLITSRQGVSRQFRITAPLDGSPVWVDLLNRSVGSTGQLKIGQSKPAFESWREATEWIFRMEIPTGGLVEHTDEFPFEAPEEGYQQVVEFRYQQDEPAWSLHIRKNFYIKFGSPARYGRISVDTSIHKATVNLEFAINPTGSRNLEEKEAAPARRELAPGVTEIIPDHVK